jgi:hypothetical protein
MVKIPLSFRYIHLGNITMSRCLCLLSTLILAGCNFNLGSPGVPGSGVITKEVRDVADFQHIVFDGSADVEYVAGGEPFCEIETDDNLQSLITTEVNDGELKISREGNVSPSQRMKIKLSSSALSSISAAGSFSVNASEVKGPKLALSFSGSGKANLSGLVDELSIDIAGSGSVGSLELAAQNVSVSISGSGSVQVNAEQTLAVSVAGSGKVEYTGNAQVEQSISGSGVVKAIASQP